MVDDNQEFVGAILAAGKGERLFPLTGQIPKPLLPFAGIEVISYLGYALRNVGITKLVVNVHHLAEQVITYSKTNPFGFDITISDERTALLGTGGALGVMRGIRKGRGLVVINGDIVTDFPLATLLAYHREHSVAATMALLPTLLPNEQKVWCKGGQVLAIGTETAPCPEATPHGFACIQVLSPEFLELFPENSTYSVMDIYRQALNQGMHIGGFSHEAFWYDIGTPQAYLRAHRALLSWWAKHPFGTDYDPLGVVALQAMSGKKMQFLPSQEGGPCLFAADQVLRADTIFGPFVVINENCAIAMGAKLAEAVLLSHSEVAAGETVVRAILAPNCVVNC